MDEPTITHDLHALRCRTTAGRIVRLTTALTRRRTDIATVLWDDRSTTLGRRATEFTTDQVIIETDAGDEIRLSHYLEGDDDLDGTSFTAAYADNHTPPKRPIP